MGNPFCHIELTTSNLEGAREFYTKVFDWKLNDVPNAQAPYVLIDTGDKPEGGMMSIPEPGVPTAWLAYIQVDDVDACCAKINENGGKVWKEPEDVPGFGRGAVVCDPQGAYFGLWKTFR
jgi:predicted enzyme related to lactoylglutathione lyase